MFEGIGIAELTAPFFLRGLGSGTASLRRWLRNRFASNGTPRFLSRTFPMKTLLLFLPFHKSQHGIHLLLALIGITKDR